MENQLDNNGENSNGLIVSILSITIAILLGYIGYIYYAKDVLKKGEIKRDYLKKDEIKKDYVKKDDVSFDMLPSYIQSNYISRFQYDNKIEKIANMEKRIKQLDSINDVQQNSARSIIVPKLLEIEKIVNKEVDVEKIVEVEKIIEKIVEVEIEAKPIVIDKTKYQTYTCKTLKKGVAYISKQCKKDLISFLKINNNAKMYEVIGMVDRSEFRLIKKLEDIYGKNKIGNLAKYAQIGLSRKRVIEATWIVKKNLPKNRNINNVNYMLTQKDKRGFVVRAYK